MCVSSAKCLAARTRGEQTAAALESRLSGLERKIDLLLASVDADATSPSNLTVVAGGQDTQPSANPPGQNGVTDSSGKGEDKSGEGLGSQGR